MNDIINVKDRGVIGDGITNDLAAIQAVMDEAFGLESAPNGRTNRKLNKEVYFPAGVYRIVGGPIKLTKLSGAHIYGAARLATTIMQASADQSVFSSNGCEYSRFERMALSSPLVAEGFESKAGTANFLLGWDNTSGAALQSNTFADMHFYGNHYGVKVGAGGHNGPNGYMGSENLFLNCFFSRGAWAGLGTMGYNALQQTVIGGNFAFNRVGCYVDKGSIPVIHGAGFQYNSLFDIVVNNSVTDGYSIAGCRTESANFAQFTNSPKVHISGIRQTSPEPGVFLRHDGQATIENISSYNGIVSAQSSAQIAIRNSQFNRPDFLYFTRASHASLPPHLPYSATTCLELESILFDKAVDPATGRAYFREVRKRRLISNPDQSNTLVIYDYPVEAVPGATPIPVNTNSGPGPAPWATPTPTPAP